MVDTLQNIVYNKGTNTTKRSVNKEKRKMKTYYGQELEKGAIYYDKESRYLKFDYYRNDYLATFICEVYDEASDEFIFDLNEECYLTRDEVEQLRKA